MTYSVLVEKYEDGNGLLQERPIQVTDEMVERAARTLLQPDAVDLTSEPPGPEREDYARAVARRLLASALDQQETMEPCCEWCGDTHLTCDQCGQSASAKTCGSCGSLVCEIEAMHVGDEREARGLPRVAPALPTKRRDEETKP